MKKQSSRRIPYRVYKKMFSECKAYDYENGTIVVDFPKDYLESKFYTPEGWYRGGNYVSLSYGRTSGGVAVSISIAQFSDGGCKYYDAYVTVGNVFANGRQHSKLLIRSFDEAVQWSIKKAKECVA